MNSGNALEPASLVQAFLKHPPCDFHPEILDDGTPGFVTLFDLLTTLEEPIKKILSKIPLFGLFSRTFLRPRTLFIGTTVSEYLVYTGTPPNDAMCKEIQRYIRDQNINVVIAKDIPDNSPLLSPEENQHAASFATTLQEQGYIVSTGQALAYVPIDFSSIEEYLGRLSANRRKDLRRKLKKRDALTVKTVRTGDIFFSDAALNTLYELYENVYNQSLIHFDKLHPAFFREILKDGSNGGVVFLYYHDEKLIGYNLCFEYRGNLIDKYIGFRYPEATDYNLYFLSWFVNLEYALANRCKHYIAGWTDPEVKASLGARFTFTKHAVYLNNPVLRFILQRFPRVFESDFNAIQEKNRSKA